MASCSWCSGPIPADARQDSRFCGKLCRQAAFRLRRRRTTFAVTDQPLVFAYADPPYPGLARAMYGREPTFAGEVDHGALVAELEAAAYGGWALSTGAYALRDVLPLCPPHARVCSWVKPHGAHPRTNGLHNVWEPLIVVGGRQVPPGKRDALVALPARGGGSLPGRKPLAFCAWLFECLGMQPGDELVDLFPGTGIVGRAWGELSAVASSRSDGSVARSSGDASLLQRRDGSPTTSGDAYPSPRARGDASPAAARDASPSPAGDTSSYSCHAPRRCR